MTKFEAPSFSVFPGSEKNYRDNYDRIFGKKKDKPDPWADEPDAEPTGPKKMSDLPPPREVQQAPKEKPVKTKKTGKMKSKNEKTKAKAKKKK